MEELEQRPKSHFLLAQLIPSLDDAPKHTYNQVWMSYPSLIQTLAMLTFFAPLSLYVLLKSVLILGCDYTRQSKMVPLISYHLLLQMEAM